MFVCERRRKRGREDASVVNVLCTQRYKAMEPFIERLERLTVLEEEYGYLFELFFKRPLLLLLLMLLLWWRRLLLLLLLLLRGR